MATTLWGRDDERTALARAVESAETGAGAGLLLEGDAGIGKTRLLDELVRLARGRGFEVFTGTASELERARPLSAVAHALGPLRADLVQHMDPIALASDDQQPTLFASIEAILDTLRSRSSRHPVLLCIDDLHWADAATITFVSAAFRSLERLPLLVAGALRPSGWTPELARLVERAGPSVHRLRLGALDDDAVRGLVAELTGGDPGPDLVAMAAQAGGSPLFLLELLAALEQAGALVRDGARVETTGAGLPPSLRLTITSRTAALPADTIDAMRTASMLGTSFSLDDLVLLSEVTALESLRRLDPAIGAGFLRSDGERIAFSHDLVRAAIYEDVPPDARRAVHRQIATTLAAAGRAAVDVAPHILLSARPGDADAIDWLMRAVAEIGTQSYEISVDLLERAAALCDDDDERRREIEVQLAGCLNVTFRSVEAAELARRLLAEPLRDVLRARVQAVLAAALGNVGSGLEMRDAWRRVYDDPASSPLDRARAAFQLAALALADARLDEAEALARQVIDDAGVDRYARAEAAGILTLISSAQGRLEDAAANGRAAVDLAEETWYARQGIAIGYVANAFALLDGDRFDDAVAQIEVGRERSERTGLSAIVQHQASSAFVHYLMGDWETALVEAEATFPHPDQKSAGIYLSVAVAGRISLHRGELERAGALVERGDRIMAVAGLGAGVEMHFWVKALVEEARGQGELAMTILEHVLAGTRSRPFLFGFWRVLWRDLIRMAAANGRNDLIDEAVRSAAEGSRLAGSVGSFGVAAAHIAALAEADARALGNIADALAATPRVLEATLAFEDAGRALRDADRIRAVSFLDRAHDGFTSLGARTDTDRVRSVLRELGETRRGRRPARRAATGWDALTPMEQRVVDLVAEGLTNGEIGARLFISTRTAQTHVRNIFDKLGVRTRTEVAVERAKRPASAP